MGSPRRCPDLLYLIRETSFILGKVTLWGSVVTYAHYACVADCADAMADAWEDTAGCAQAICLHENLLKI